MPIAVLTADCAPILIYDNKIKMIAAIHAGWKGAFKGIINRVIKFMIKKGCRLENITAVIGPTISAKNYEVQDDFKKKFIKREKKNIKFFKRKKNKLYFDLTNYIYTSLKIIKIKHIDVLKIDVEGSEIEVLEGGVDILKNTNIIQIEIFDTKKLQEEKVNKIKLMLFKLDFELKKIKTTWSSQQMSNTKSADALFVRKNISDL